jgi:hypothetical protein
MIHNAEEMQGLANEWGFLPFFAGEIPGFSIEENIDLAYWFPDDEENGMGAWDWKGECIVQGDLAYGKFYRGKACYVSMEWFPDFMNYRRSKVLLADDEQQVLATLKEHHSLISRELKRLCGYVKPRTHRAANPLERELEKETRAVVKPQHSKKKGFDTVINHLQMGTYVVTADFEWLYDREGRRHGWGLARYATPEDFFGAERLVVDRSPEESRQRIFEHLQQLLPQATEAQIERVIG